MRELAGDPALGLTALTRDALLDRRIGWAHVSELLDPAPYLLGGELLLTAGLGLPPAAADGPTGPAHATASPGQGERHGPGGPHGAAGSGE
ncbi:PucR family transcriptional regulator ligand-binding domain-containing protein, partial [Streptomyces fuscigenes]|uniref:PucR family transcriptional regulator ligand-binding domain-containing protein n=1 Tax=Streptomyces fuscigenes TaxID=1528880 RepID=UPI001F313BCC